MYNNNHKYFLQYMLKHMYISSDIALKYCEKFEEVSDMKTLQIFISEINQNISKQDLKISLAKCEVTSKEQVILLNTSNDDVSKLQNNNSPITTEYFQAILKELITSDDHKIKIMTCYGLSNSLTGALNKDNVEKLLEKWTNEGYFVQDGTNIYLGARCIMEFAPYFSVHCKDYYVSCYLCSESVFIGRSCKSCQKLMHKHCVEKYLKKQKNCPNCRKEWRDSESSNSDSEGSDS